MSKWEKEFKKGLPCKVEDFICRRFKVKMCGWARFFLRGNIKVIDEKGNGVNEWQGAMWGKFKLSQHTYDTVKLDYDQPGNSKGERRIVDYVRGNIGDFRKRIFGIEVHIAWFTLKEIERSD